MSLVLSGDTGVSGNTGALTSGTPVASTSGTSIDFTSIPSWVKRITVMFSGVSVSGTSTPQVQIGSGSVDVTGYTGGQSVVLNSNITGSQTSTTGFIWNVAGSASSSVHGNMVLTLLSSNNWVCNGVGWDVQGSRGMLLAGSKTLSGTLDRVRITTVNGTDTFDAGSINILYE